MTSHRIVNFVIICICGLNCYTTNASDISPVGKYVIHNQSVTRDACIFQNNLTSSDNSINVFMSTTYKGEIKDPRISEKYNETNEDIKDEVVLQADSGRAKEILSLWQRTSISFIPENNAGEQCLRDSKVLQEAIMKGELWALKMFDSSAKMPSGILSGNINQLGDYDQCLSIKKPMKGKYCLAQMDISLVKNGLSKEVDSLMHSHYFINSNITDPGHRVPKASMVNWAVCLPASCRSSDLQSSMERHLQGLGALVRVEGDMCVTGEESITQGRGRQAALTFFGLLLLTIYLATHYENEKRKNNNNVVENGKMKRLLLCFSLRSNLEKLLETSMKEEVPGLDGVRALNALFLLLFHKSLALFFLPLVNRTTMSEVFSRPWSVLGRTAAIYTDSFMLISGFLTSRTLLKDLNKSGSLKFKNKLINRLFRILPSLVAVILFCTYILPDAGDGPMWPLVINKYSQLCQQNMWRNFLFVQNYFGLETMCLTHTHQLSIDMQLFVVTPLLVLLLWRHRRAGLYLVLGIAVVSTMLRAWTAFAKELSIVVHFGMPVKKAFETANSTYTLPTHRATIYLMGVSLAYFMSNKESQIHLTKAQTYIGWLCAITMGLLAMIGPFQSAYKDFKYDAYNAAVFNAFLPLAWGAFIAWTIWATANNCSGWFGRFLSWRGFRIFTKIAYGVYLTQFPIYFFNVGSLRHAGYYKPRMLFEIPEVLCIIIISTILTLFVEMPFSRVCKILTENGVSKKINSGIKDEERKR